jgi:predicted phage terminase large subunit-like protein
MAMSLAQQVAALPDEQREVVLAGLNQADLAFDWGFWGRPEQRRPITTSGWSVCAYIAGRGAGKTKSASEWAREKSRTMPGSRAALVARTAADVRDVLIQGESGIIACSPPSERPEWEPSKRLLTWPNGTTALAFSSEEPSQLRGPQFHWALADEWAAWKWVPDDSGLTAWENLRIATRLGDNPQIFAMTTPKRVPALKELLAESEDHPNRVLIVRGSTMDNAGNLSSTYLDVITGLYEGTHLARQELYGEMLDDIEGALWTETGIGARRIHAIGEARGPLMYVVGVDPSVAENPKDECGIIVVASTKERMLTKRQAYVIEDASIHGSPDKWAQEVARVAKKYRAPVVAEVNQGGSLVRMALQTVDADIKVMEVRATKGKALRAEPVVMAYEQGRVSHIDWLADLEAQMTTWVPGETKKSPDRIDALVHGLTALLITPPTGLGAGPIRAKSPSAGRIPSMSAVGGGRGRR